MFLAALFFYLTGFGLLLSDFMRRLEFSYFVALIGAILVALSFGFFIGGMMQNKRIHEESSNSLP
jgi:hypothetical protein